MKIFLSNQGNLRNMQTFLKSIDWSNSNKLEITTHDKWITVHPANLVLTAALAMRVGKDNAEIIGDVPDSGRYLDRMGLYKLTKTLSPFTYQEKESAGRFVPITVVKTAEAQSHFISEMIPLLHLSERDAKVIKYIIGELVRNVLEHAGTSDGAIVAAQYYKKTNKVSIAICDTGMGVWKSMNESWHPKTDLEAIRLSLTPGITGTTSKEGGTSENAGAGLFFIKSIAKLTRSYFTIYSGTAEYTLLKNRTDQKTITLHADPFSDNSRYTNDLGDFRGTLVAVDITLDDTPEFKAIMAHIGDVYGDAIRERKRIKYRRPNFI
ncbi:MAG: ATP-binding protein [Candidatus Saccharibacteria bacterium]|nr:ATP-binding protein [Candidatus Saccharibacteria bacterium]